MCGWGGVCVSYKPEKGRHETVGHVTYRNYACPIDYIFYCIIKYSFVCVCMVGVYKGQKIKQNKY